MAGKSFDFLPYLLSSPSRGMWVETLDFFLYKWLYFVILLTGDVGRNPAKQGGQKRAENGHPPRGERRQDTTEPISYRLY